MCAHYCHCGYQHTSRDQVAEHQKSARHARSQCKIYMMLKNLYSEFRERMGWSSTVTFGPLLPVTRRVSRVKVEARPNTPPPSTPKEAAAASTTDSTMDVNSQSPEPPASPPASPRASAVPLLEGEGLGMPRWQTAPHVAMAEDGARAIVEKLLRRHQPSSCVPGLRHGRAAMLQLDVDDLESRAREVDDARRAGRFNLTEEGALREEAARLRTAAAQFRHLVGLLAH